MSDLLALSQGLRLVPLYTRTFEHEHEHERILAVLIDIYRGSSTRVTKARFRATGKSELLGK
jgi:hypothetical protein